MPMINVIVVDPTQNKIEMRLVENSLQSIYQITGASFVEHLRLPDNVILFNEMPMTGRSFRMHSGHVIDGPAVIVGQGEDFINTTLTVEEVRDGITFLD